MGNGDTSFRGSCPGDGTFPFAAAGQQPGACTPASLDRPTLKQIRAHSPPRRTSRPGLLFSRGRSLMAQPFDAGKLEPQGNPVAIADPV